MFTGIIESIGILDGITSRGNYRLLTIRSEKPWGNLSLGESIAVDGCCLTLTAFDEETFTLEASQETSRLTIVNDYGSGSRVNLERALLPVSRLGGHFVTGHIDGTGVIMAINQVGESWEMEFEFPQHLAVYLAPKGSIAINGVSLTVNEVWDYRFKVNIIPFTFQHTTLNRLGAGERVNLEFDLIAKYILRQLQGIRPEGLTLEKLIAAGFGSGRGRE